MNKIIPMDYSIPFPPNVYNPTSELTIDFDGEQIEFLFYDWPECIIPIDNTIWYFKKNKKFAIISPFIFEHWEELSDCIDDFIRKLIRKNPWIKVLECDEIIYHKFNPFIIDSTEKNLSHNYFYLVQPLPVRKDSIGKYCYDIPGGIIYTEHNNISNAEAKIAYKCMKNKELFFVTSTIFHDKLYISDFISDMDMKISKDDIILTEQLKYDIKNIEELRLRFCNVTMNPPPEYSVNSNGKHVLHKILERWVGDETLWPADSGKDIKTLP